MHISLTAFAADVAEKSNGTINIQIFPNGTLGSESDMISQVQFGMLDMAKVSASTLGNYNKLYNAYSVPYVFDNQAHYYAVMDGEIAQELYMATEGDGFIGLTWLDSGSRSFYITDAAYQKADFSKADLTGLKIRMQNNAMMVRMIELLGGTGVTGIGANEVYSSIQTGVVDGAENNWPTYQDKGDFEVATTYVLDYHTRVPEILIMSEIASYMVSAEDLEIIKQCAKETQEFEKEQWKLKEVAAEEIVRGNGNTIVELTAEEMAAYEAKMAPLYDEFGAAYTDVIDAIKAVGENF